MYSAPIIILPTQLIPIVDAPGVNDLLRVVGSAGGRGGAEEAEDGAILQAGLEEDDEGEDEGGTDEEADEEQEEGDDEEDEEEEEGEEEEEAGAKAGGRLGADAAEVGPALDAVMKEFEGACIRRQSRRHGLFFPRQALAHVLAASCCFHLKTVLQPRALKAR